MTMTKVMWNPVPSRGPYQSSRKVAKPEKSEVKPLNNIRTLRIRSGLTQTDLSGMSGISRDTICQLERDGHQPQQQIAIALANALGVDVGVLRGTIPISVFRSQRYLPVDQGFYLVRWKETTPVGDVLRHEVVWFVPGRKKFYHVASDGKLLTTVDPEAEWTVLPD